MQPTLELHQLTPVEWPVLRAARLQALRESPHAFMSRYDHESRLSELEWRRLFDAATWIVAQEGEDVVGLARSVGEPATPWARHVESIWVAPTHRRRGVFRALLSALTDVERRMGVSDLLIWVLEDNQNAQRAYETVGFRLTGERQFLPGLGRFERRLRLRIRHLPGS